MTKNVLQLSGVTAPHLLLLKAHDSLHSHMRECITANEDGYLAGNATRSHSMCVRLT